MKSRHFVYSAICVALALAPIAATAQVIGSLLWGPTDRLMTSYKVPVLAGTLAMAVAYAVLAAVGTLPVAWLAVWLGAFGFVCASAVVMIAHGKSLFPPHLVGRGLTLLNMGSMAGVVFNQIVSGIVIDLFRDYPTHRLALGTGQTLNLVMAALGAVLLYRSRLRRLGRLAPRPPAPAAPVVDAAPALWQRALFVALLLGCLTIPSNWTQDIPAHYGARHPGQVRCAQRLPDPVSTLGKPAAGHFTDEAVRAGY